MSLSYIPYTNIDLLERLDLQTLNNAFEKLYLNDLFYSEIDRIAPKIFINGATYHKGDCVWYNTEDPYEFVLSSNVHWRLIKYQINEQDLDAKYPMASKYDLLVVVSGDTYPNTIEHGGELSRTDWNVLSGQYIDAISCAYDIGDITKPVQIYQYLGDSRVLNIPNTKRIRYSDQKYLLSAYFPESAAKAETRTFTDLSIYMDESAIISVETSLGDVTWKVLSAGCTYPLKEMSLKMPIYTVNKFYDSNWKPLLDSPVDKQDIVNYVLNRLEEHVNKDLSSVNIYREHTTAHSDTLSLFQMDYLNRDFSNISDDICQMDIPNLTLEQDHNTNTGFDYVYETVIDGDRGYRLWKSGLLEHWGKLTLDEQDFTGVSGWSYGYKVNLNWTYNAPDGNMYRSKTYTYDLSNSNTTNSNVNTTVNVYGESEYLLADDNRYQVMYTWCNSSNGENQYYKKILGTEYADNTDANIINFTECNVYNVKNTSFTIPNIAYLLGTDVEDGYVHHLHPTLYYYTSGFSRHVNQNMYNKREKIIVYDLNELQLGGSFDSTWKYTGSPIKPDFQLTKGGIVIVGSGGTNQYHIDGQKLGAETNISRIQLNDCSSASAISVYYDAGGTARGCYLKEGEPKTKPLSQWTVANHADYVNCRFSDTWSQHFAWDGDKKTWIELNDYIYHYENNVNASTYSATPRICVEGLYECGISKSIKGQRTFEFSILPIAALDCYMMLYSYSYAYQAEEIVPEVYIAYNGSQIPESDYTIEAWNNKVVGTASIRATFTSNNIEGFIGDSFEIYKADMADCEIQLEHESYEYQGGSQIKPKGTVSLNGVELVEGVDYQVQYTNATYVAEDWPIRFIGINNLSGYQDLSFSITKVDISEATDDPTEDNPMFIGWSSSGLSLTDSVFELSASTDSKANSTTTKYKYGLLPMSSSEGTSTVGIPKTFTLMVSHNGKRLTNGQDYIVKFPEGLEPQQLAATKVTVYGIGNYYNEKTVEAVPMTEGQNYRIVI